MTITTTTKKLTGDFRRLIIFNSIVVAFIVLSLIVQAAFAVDIEYFAVYAIAAGAVFLYFTNHYSVFRAKKNLEDSLKIIGAQITRDELTEVYNRRGGEEHFRIEIERARRKKLKLTAAILDGDDFKKINDTYGHIAGDKVLKEIAQSARKYMRDGDIVYRYGGEEFVIILPNTDEETAYVPLERLRRRLSEKKVKYNGVEISFSVSIGVAEIIDPASEKLEELIGRADKALYRAKESGKNKVVCQSQLEEGNVSNLTSLQVASNQ